MSVFDETAAMLGDLRKAIADQERRLAKSRRRFKTSDAGAADTEALLETTH